jgi:hypothetical protein
MRSGYYDGTERGIDRATFFPATLPAIEPGQRYVKHLRNNTMTTVTVDYIWQAIRESERSDEFQFMADQLRIKAEAARLAQLRHIQSDAVTANPIADAAINPAHRA